MNNIIGVFNKKSCKTIAGLSSLVALSLFTLFYQPSKNKISGVGQSHPDFNLPIIYMPTCDIENENGLEGVSWFNLGNGEFELNLIFSDEDDPYIDKIVDIYHDIVYKRAQDIETVILVVKNGIVESAKFNGSYSGSAKRSSWKKLHNDAVISFRGLNDGFGDLKKKTIKLYINSRNHMIGEKNNNHAISLTQIDLDSSKVPVYHLSRSQLEGMLRKKN